MAQLVWQMAQTPRPSLGQWAARPIGLALLATAFLVLATLASPGPSLFDWLGDTDDAVRLLAVRELLGGAPWFDTTLPRIGAPDPLVSHWSRLIDLPLAVLVGGFTPLLGPDRAELATRIVWPALLFLALARIVAGEAQRRSGPMGAAFALALVATSALALAQFRPGRIDHHNAQILCAVAGLLYLARSLEHKRAGWTAGLFLGLGLAIGYEAIALVVPAMGLAVLAAAWRPRHCAPMAGDGVARTVLATAMTLAAALIATVPPNRWLAIHCDALSLNLVVFAASAAGGVWTSLVVPRRARIRVWLLGASLAAAAGVYAGLEPACLAGPFGQVSPALKSLWLDRVMETRSILWLGGLNPAPALATVAFLLIGAAAQVALWRRRGDMGHGLAAAFVVLAAALGCWQIKLLPYACWLAALALAQWAAQWGATASRAPMVVRIAAVVLLSQATLDAAFGALSTPFRSVTAPARIAAETGDPRRACFQTAVVRRLAALPAGLVAADIDLGPYIVALSPHRIVAAPYHRLAQGILANHAIFDGSPEGAQRRLAALGVDYVALCADRSEPANGAMPTLRERLLAGERFGFLRPIDVATGGAMGVWRFAPAR
jgi:hypothetical protein